MRSNRAFATTRASDELARTAVPAGYDRAATTMALVPLLQQFGVDLHQVLTESGLPAGMFDHPDNLLPFRHGSRLLGLCADRTGCAHLGLLIGQHSPLEALGMLSDLVKAAPNVRGALRLLARYLRLSDGGGLLALHEDSGFIVFSYAVYEPRVERVEVVYDIALGTMWNVMRALCGEAWGPHEVWFPYSCPADVRPYRRFLRAPLRFDCEQCAIVFDKKWLDVPLRGANPRQLRALEAQARAIEEKLPNQLPAQIREVVRRHMLSGSTSITRVASEMGVHRRTLDRHLKAHRINFKTLADEVRFEVARQLLSTTSMPVAQVARCLHYANAGAFSTAFRRWSSCSPTQWRSARLVRTAIAGHA